MMLECFSSTMPDDDPLAPSPAWNAHVTPTTVDRTDRKFLTLCHQIYITWKVELAVRADARLLPHEQKIKMCLSSQFLRTSLRELDIEDYLDNLLRIFGEQVLIRVLAKHVSLT